MKIARRTQVNAEGNLWLQLSAELRDYQIKVTVEVAEPADPGSLGWPPAFFKQTAGVWEGEVLKQPPQDDYERRDWHLL
jgi:hypothetical protein